VNDAIRYLLEFILNSFFMVLILRVWLQLVRADFYNPISQFIVKVTNPVVIPARRIIPSVGNIDLATVVLAYLVAIMKIVVMTYTPETPIDILGYMIYGGLFVIKQTGFLLFMSMLIMAIMSWVVQGYNPTMMILQQLTEPFLRPIRKVIPPIAGLDLSIIIAFVALNFLNIFLSGLIAFWSVL
jgi:YggT family protein